MPRNKKRGCFDEACPDVSDLGIDIELLRENYSGVPSYDSERFKSVVNLAVMLIEHVLLEGFKYQY